MSGLVLVAEDDDILRDFIVATLKSAGFTTMDVPDGMDALRAARATLFDVIVLDRNMGLDGVSVLKTLRNEGVETPAMFLTAAGEVTDRVLGLEAGADDYMAKPFEAAELIARVRALARRPSRLAASALIADAFRLDLSARRTFVADREVELTAQDFALMEIFVRYPNRTFTREALLLRLGISDDAAPSAVEHAISRLRKKVQEVAGIDPIETVRGAGYRFRREAPD